MATVIYPNANIASNMTAFMNGMSVFADALNKIKYKRALNQLLGEYESNQYKEEIEKIEMQLPTEWIPKDMRQGGFPTMPENQAMQMVPSNFQKQTVNELVQRQMTPEEKRAYDDKYRGKIEAIGANISPSNRVNPYTIIPDRGQEKDLEKELALRAAYRSGKWVTDNAKENPGLYNLNDPADRERAKAKRKEGFTLTSISGDMFSEYIRQFGAERFLGGEEDVKGLQSQIQDFYLTPDVKKEQGINKTIAGAEGYSDGSAGDRAVIAEARKKLESLKVKDWSNPTPFEQKAIEAIQNKYIDLMWKRDRDRRYKGLKTKDNVGGVKF